MKNGLNVSKLSQAAKLSTALSLIGLLQAGVAFGHGHPHGQERKVPSGWSLRCTAALKIAAHRNARFEADLERAGGLKEVVDHLEGLGNSSARTHWIHRNFERVPELNYVIGRCR